MDFAKTYTTAEKIASDTSNIEAKKVVLSNDAYALTEALHKFIDTIERYH